jgi:hypothetical protein
VNLWRKQIWLSGVLFVAAGLTSPARAQSEMPRLERQGDRHALLVDGKPYLLLGAQINNSSSWPSTLPAVWPALRDLHANTVEAPVYWERMEPQQGQFSFEDVDMLIRGAREHQLRLVLLWFGTWKNGQNHYVPEWMKANTKRFPREISAEGKLLDVMSPSSPANLSADKTAFAALMKHVGEVDGQQHTVILVQVENESGSIGSVRDHTSAADEEFSRPVPAWLVHELHVKEGSWQAVFGAAAEERYAAFATARFINEVAKAGKAAYALPMYCNVWITYPVHALVNRDAPSPGQEYPSGGPQQGNFAIWKATAPAIDVLAPDFYSDDFSLFQEVVKVYARPDNALMFPENGITKHFGRDLFYALGHGAVGFAPFGIDYTEWTLKRHEIPAGFAEDFAVLAPMEDVVAKANLDDKLQTIVEGPGLPRRSTLFGDVEVQASFGFPQRDGEVPPGTSDAHGRALVMQTGPLDFVVTGVDASVSFALREQAGTERNEQLEILRTEEGHYADGVWHMDRIWNGDQTDRGLNFFSGTPQVVRIWLHTLPLKVHPAHPRE